MQMRLFYPTIISLSILVHAALAFNALTPVNAPLNVTGNLDGGPGNQTLHVPAQPIQFSLAIEVGGPKLNRTALLMNAVDALKILALDGWQTGILDGTEYRLALCPEVSISVNTRSRKKGANLQARFVVWAIMMGVVHMISENKFEFAQFEMKWNGVVLGWVHVVNNPTSAADVPGLVLPSANQSLIGVAKRSPPPATLSLPSTNTTLPISEPNTNTTIIPTDLTTDAAEEARLKTTFTPTGEVLSIYDVFLPIMNALSDMASYPSTQRSEGLVAGFEGMQGIVCILPIESVEYQWLVRTIARIPAFMLEDRRFGEVNIKMELDGVRVAWGRVCVHPGGCQGVEERGLI